MAPTVAFAGKGGVGKTTLAGTFARIVARQGRKVLAVDADLNPNLAISLGMDPKLADTRTGLPSGIVSFAKTPDGQNRLVLTRSFDSIVQEFGTEAPDGVQLLLMGRPDHAGTG